MEEAKNNNKHNWEIKIDQKNYWGTKSEFYENIKD